MRAINSSALVVLLASLAAGCATDGGDSAGSGGSGGKGDDPNGEEGLFVTARTTTLGEYNVIRWPVAVDDSSEVDDAINAGLDFEAITGEKLEDIQNAWAAAAEDEPVGGIVGADFEVNANIRNVLSVSINIETMGAYPDFFSSYQNFNANTGEKVAITDILSAESLPALAAELDSRLELEIALQKNRLSAEIASGEIDETIFDDLHVTVEDLSNFSTTEEGITFRWDAGFPHVIQALEPDFSTSFTIDELDSAISPEGLWADEY